MTEQATLVKEMKEIFCKLDHAHQTMVLAELHKDLSSSMHVETPVTKKPVESQVSTDTMEPPVTANPVESQASTDTVELPEEQSTQDVVPATPPPEVEEEQETKKLKLTE